MEVFNTLYPQWHLVPCNELLSVDVVCKTNHTQDKSDKHVHCCKGYRNVACSKELVLVKNKCIRLKRRTSEHDKLLHWDIKMLHPFIEYASLVSEKQIYFSVKHNEFITFDKLKKQVKSISNLSKDKAMEAFLISVSPQINKTFALRKYKNQLHKCNSSEYVSKMALFNGKKDCQSGEDFYTVMCSVGGHFISGATCITTCKQPLCECSDLFHQNIHGGCQPFKGEREFKSKEVKKEEHRTNNKTIFTDCTETEINALESKTKVSTFVESCPDSQSIQCTYSCKRCFPLHKLCVYELDSENNLMYCPSGNHVKNCKLIECNNMYKCKNQHCIPFR